MIVLFPCGPKGGTVGPDAAPQRRSAPTTRSKNKEPQRNPRDEASQNSPRPNYRDLQHALLLAAVTHHGGRLRFSTASAETLTTTFAALRNMERRKLIVRETRGDSEIITWKITAAGKAAIAGNRPE
jgi:hypothetical protein